MKKAKFKKITKIDFSISLKNYYHLFKVSLTNPNIYSKSIPEKVSLTKIWLFYLFNISISLLLYIFIKKIFIPNTSIFFDLSSLLLFIPFFILLLYFVSFLLHFLIKFFGGKGNYTDTLKALVFASFPLVILRVPYIGILGVFLSFFFSINNIKHIHRVSYLTAGFCVFLPFFMIILSITLLLSISNFNFFRI